MPTNLEAAFEPVANSILALTKENGLHLEKYYHDFPTWTIGFVHPLGGQAKIDVTLTKNGRFTVQSFWWRDDRENWTRSIKRGRPTTLELEYRSQLSQLRKEVDDVLTWSDGEWDQVVGDYKLLWSSISESDFEKEMDRWPLPSACRQKEP